MDDRRVSIDLMAMNYATTIMNGLRPCDTLGAHIAHTMSFFYDDGMCMDGETILKKPSPIYVFGLVLGMYLTKYAHNVKHLEDGNIADYVTIFNDYKKYQPTDGLGQIHAGVIIGLNYYNDPNIDHKYYLHTSHANKTRTDRLAVIVGDEILLKIFHHIVMCFILMYLKRKIQVKEDLKKKVSHLHQIYEELIKATGYNLDEHLKKDMTPKNHRQTSPDIVSDLFNIDNDYMYM